MRHLIAGCQALGLDLTASQQAAFDAYYEELVAWNQKFNLTAITDYEQVQVRHFLDSLSCLLADQVPTTLSRPGARAIDVGSGAGFPGIPLKLACPQAEWTLLEATGKKVTFLQHIIARLELEGVTPIHARAEEMGRSPFHREQYDLGIARAVAELPILVELLLPFCRVGGWAVAQKGADGAEEAAKAEGAIDLLGGALSHIVQVALPGLPEARFLVVIKKTGPTPADYPRRPGIPRKRPLTG